MGNIGIFIGMKSPWLRLLTTFLILALVTGGLLWHQANIDGHWHIVERTGSGFSGLYTLDIRDCEEPYNDEFLFSSKGMVFDDHLGLGSGFGGVLDRLRREIYVYPHCSGMHLKYQRWGDSLFLTATEYNGTPTGSEAVAFRCNDDCCDPQLDLFADSDLLIDLPIWTGAQEEENESSNNAAMALAVFIGRDVNDAFMANQYASRKLLLDDVPLYIEQHLVKMPERRRSEARLRLYADRQTPQAVMDSIVSVFLAVRPDLGVERVYRQEELSRPLRLYVGE